MPTARKKAGRPRGRKAPLRPVISTRVADELYERVKTAAEDNNRTMSQEIAWRVKQSFVIEEKQ